MIRSRALKTEALVLGSRRLGEADRVVSLYTREKGRLSGVAKGVRRTRSKVGGRLEPFSLVHVILYIGHGSLYTITSVDTIRTFQPIREELFRMEEGARLLASARRLFPEEEESAPAFNLLVRGVAALAAATDRVSAAQVVLATRLKLLLLQGYLPELDTCISCGAREDLCGFQPALGGVLCLACFSADAHDCFVLSPEALQAVRTLIEQPLSDLGGVLLSPVQTLEAELVVSETMSHHGH